MITTNGLLMIKKKKKKKTKYVGKKMPQINANQHNSCLGTIVNQLYCQPKRQMVLIK